MGEGHVTAAAIVEFLDALYVVPDGIAVLDTDDGDAFALAMKAADVGRGEGQAHDVGGDGLREAMDGFELFNGLSVGNIVGFGRRETLADIDDEEGNVHIAVNHFGQIDLGGKPL